jgi:putative ABC transport system permease protein
VGALTGLLAGAALILGLKLVPAFHGYVEATVHLPVLLAVVLLALITGALGALYPAFFAMRVRAVEALRFE